MPVRCRLSDGVQLQPNSELVSEVTLTPMLRYMDNVSLVSVRFLQEEIFVPGSLVRRGTFIEDTFGKHAQMQKWLGSAAYASKLPPRNGCFLLTDSLREPMMRHLDGKIYLDPSQRAAAGLPAYPKDWTAALKDSSNAARDAAHWRKSWKVAQRELVPIRDALCWDAMADGCSSAACGLLHPRHAGTTVCGRHATSVLGLWGRRRRPPCPGDCGKAHPTASELEAALSDALPEDSRLHVHIDSPPCFEGSEPHGGTRHLYVAPSNVSPAEADGALAARAPMALRVAIDVGFDRVMSEGERKSLATQCGLCHGIASQAEHRPHVALAICCGTAEGNGAGEDSCSLLRAAGIEQWRPVAWQSRDGKPLSLLSMPGAELEELVYLSPDAPDELTELKPSEVYVIGGLVDRPKISGASFRRASALGIRCARLPLLEHLPQEMRGRSNALDALNLNAVFRLLVEWSKSRDWSASIATAFDGAQRHCSNTAGFIHANGYWDGPRAASQHQYDGLLSEALLAFFQRECAKTVVDLGCGLGTYVSHFNSCGLSAYGFDGNPSTPQLSKGKCSVLDLSVVADVTTPYDWVLSLEVGEHLPREHEAAFMENLHRHNCRGMVLSWATKGQGGTGHVNEQNNDYVKAKICAMGYVNDVDAEGALRKSSRFLYFQRTVMVFRRTSIRS